MNLQKLVIVGIILQVKTAVAKNTNEHLNIKSYLKENVTLEISTGSSKLKTNEYVYNDYYKNLQISYLHWKSNTIKTFTSNINIKLPLNFSLNIGGFKNVNKAKRGSLNDYDRYPSNNTIINNFNLTPDKKVILQLLNLLDFVLEEKTGKEFDHISSIIDNLDDQIVKKAIGDSIKNMDWNLWSTSNAVLENYYGLHIDIQKLLIHNDKFQASIGLGYEQKKSKWYDTGGYGLYANKQVDFGKNKGIGLSNKYKIPYITLNTIINFNDKLSLSANYKKSFWASVNLIDEHILRNIKFIDKSSKKNAKYDLLDLKLTYKITDNLSIFSAYDISKLAHHRTNETILEYEDYNKINTVDFTQGKTATDANSYALSIGIKYNF